jgi:hypothetical protein
MRDHMIKSEAEQKPEMPAQQQPPKEKQYIPKEGEEYLRESGKIEDYPTSDGSNADMRTSPANDYTFGAMRSPDSIY